MHTYKPIEDLELKISKAYVEAGKKQGSPHSFPAISPDERIWSMSRIDHLHERTRLVEGETIDGQVKKVLRLQITTVIQPVCVRLYQAVTARAETLH